MILRKFNHPIFIASVLILACLSIILNSVTLVSRSSRLNDAEAHFNLVSKKSKITSNGGTLPEVIKVNLSDVVGKINSNLLGSDGPGPSGNYPINLMKQIGIKWVRLDVGFENSYNNIPDYNCATSTWNSLQFDQSVNAVKSEGARPLAIIDYTPTCLASSTSGNPNYSVPNKNGWAKWDSLVYNFAIKEIPNGVKTFEVWNEPDGTFFTSGESNYLLLYNNTVVALEKAADKLHQTILVGGPALSWWDPTWMQAFLKYVEDNNLPLNFLSWHWYADDPDFGPFYPTEPNGLCLFKTPTVGQIKSPCYYNPSLSSVIYKTQVQYVSNMLKSYPRLHPILWIDEFNVNAGYDIRMNQSYDAAFVSSVFSLVNNFSNLRMAIYNATDTPNNPYGNWGLVTYPAEKPKPVYWAFYFWDLISGINSTASRVNSSVSIQNPTYYLQNNTVKVMSNVEAIASKSSDSTNSNSVTYNIELSNFIPYDPTGAYGQSGNLYTLNSSLNISSIPAGTYRIEKYEISPSSSTYSKQILGKTKQSSLNLTLKLPAESVVLVRLIKINSTSSNSFLYFVYLAIGTIAVILLGVTLFLFFKRKDRII